MSTKSARMIKRSAKDGGFTLPELLISITLTGLLVSVLAAALVVTLRQAKSTEGRANIARAESSIDTWLPADLASTDVSNDTLPAVDRNPWATPCGLCTGIDLGGTNALQLAWETRNATGGIIVTRVQYQYIQADGEWQLRRIECIGSMQCTSVVVLHDLNAPTDPAFVPGTVRPTWILDVADPSETDPDSLALDTNAQQVLVTVNGGGTFEGAGGGEQDVNLTAGGRTTEEIEADAFTPPAFVRSRSRCGGPITLIIDDSGSINRTSSGVFVANNVENVVKPGVKAFIEAFRGTPTQIQIVKFSSTASTLGSGTGWHRYVDMTDDQAVNGLLSAVTDYTHDNGWTNWEDALFRTFRNEDGTPATIQPNRIVFFTDGVPTRNRGYGPTWRTGVAKNFNAGSYTPSSSWRNQEYPERQIQESWDRADALLDVHRSVPKIFVGVGTGLNENFKWIQNPASATTPSAAPVYPPSNTITKGSQALTYFLSNSPTGGYTPAVFTPGPGGVGGEYTNPEVADYYLQSSFDQAKFAAAMRAAALKDCGGTLTVQTRLADGTPASDEFVYENTSYRNEEESTAIEADPRRVTTSSLYRTGTFDFDIPSDSDYFKVDIVPQELQSLTNFTPIGWSCRVGGTTTDLPITPIAIDGSPFTGFTVDVRPNQAVSCILKVTQ
jgi:prepilin-type N-terminal cleavage/methylation domain-containing protein